MRIDNIHLRNFKNFTELNLDLSTGVNLVVGLNGSGKTSLLESLCVAIGAFFGGQEAKMQRMIDYDEIKINRKDGKTQRTPEASVTASWNDKKWSRTINAKTRNNDSKNARPMSMYGDEIFAKFNNEGDRTPAPLLVYYSTQRLFRSSSRSAKQSYDPAIGRSIGYLNCIKEQSIKSVLEEWLGNAVTKRATKHINGIDSKDNVLENVESAIKNVLYDVMNLPASENLRIYQDPDYDNELCVYLDENRDMPLRYYSDGFRNLIYLVIDMVWRASQLNPWLTIDELKEQTTGVVLIDEIDLHLHYRWQGKVISVLQALFPNVQFVITTHSPAVVANFEGGQLYILQDNQVSPFSGHYFGKKVNEILRDVLGAAERHIPTQKKIDALRVAADDLELETFNQLYTELSEQLGEDDLELQKAKLILEIAEENKN